MTMRYIPSTQTISLFSGEPIDLELNLGSTAKVIEPMLGRAFVFILYLIENRVRVEVDYRDGEIGTNDLGPCVRWNADGTFSADQAGKSLLWEISERLDNGRDVILTGKMDVAQSAPRVDDFNSAPRAKYITRIARYNDPDTLFDPKLDVKIVPYKASTTPPIAAPVNSVAPTISGTARVGSVLTVSTGTWSGSPTYAYVWKAGGTTISGATSASYTPVAGDLGKAITVTVTATNSGGSTSVTSAATSAVVAAPVASTPLKIALAGSSSPQYYAQGPSVGTSNARNFYSTDGTTFSVATAGKMAMDAGNALVGALNRDVQWLRGGVGGSTLNQWDEASSSLRLAVVNMIKNAGADIVLLQVGYNDIAAGNVANTAERAAKIRSVISKIRSETNLPNLPFILGGTQDRDDNPTALRAVREAEMTVALTDTNVRLGFQTYDLATSDGVHQTDASNGITAGRFAAQVLSLVNGTAQKRGPRVTAVTAVSDTVTDVTLAHVDGTDFTPTSGITGFTVFNSTGSVCAISSAVRASATTIRLTHASKGGTSGSVIYMPNGAEGDNSTIVRDNSTLALPLECSTTAFALGAGTVTPTPDREVRIAMRAQADPVSAPTGWVTITAPPGGSSAGLAGASRSNLLDTTGAASGWSIAVGPFTSGVAGGAVSSGSNSGPFPDNAISTYFYNGYDPSTNQLVADSTDITISGLNAAKMYEIKALPSRAGGTGRPTVFTLNGVSKQIEAGNNFSALATFTDIAPSSDGKIVLNWKRGSGINYAYLNALTIREYSPATTVPTERSFTYSEVEPGWTLTRSENNPAYLQFFNSSDAESVSHYMAVIEGASAAAKLDDMFKTSAADRESSVYYMVSVDGGAYTRTPYNSATDDLQLFDGLTDGPHTVALRTPPERVMFTNIKKASSPIRVTGASPKIKNANQWLVPAFDNANLHYAHSMLSTLSNLNDTSNNFKPKKYGHYFAGGAPSMTFRANVTELWVITVQRMIHLFDGTNHTVYDTGSDILTNNSSRARTYRITGLSGLKTYNIWTSFNGNISQFAVGLVGGTAQALANPKRSMDQYGDSITYGTLPAADLPSPGDKPTNGTGYSDIYRTAAALGYVGVAVGEGGLTVAGLNTNLDNWLPPRTVSSSDVAIVAIGQNGGVPDTSVYNSIIDKLVAKGYGKIICRGVIPVSGGGSAAINATISNIVSTRNDPKIKYMNVDSWSDINRPDGIHPGKTGYDQMVARGIPLLQTLLS